MNKKALIFILIALTLTPIALASLTEGIEDMLGTIFGATADLAYIKAGIWLVLFFLIFKSAERIFPQNRGAAMIIALVASMMGARFMPDEYLEYIGGGYSILLIIILMLGPFFLGSMLGDMLRWGKRGKAFLICLFYAGFAYMLIEMDVSFLGGQASTLLDLALTWMRDHTIIVLIAIALICVFALWGSGSGGGGGAPMGMSTGSGPSFWGGLGRGAGGASRFAMNKGSGMWAWMARQRAIARQRAMLKSGWAQKKQQLLSQMPRGKVSPRGTPGYTEYMKKMTMLDRVRRKLGEQAFLRRMRGQKISPRYP